MCTVKNVLLNILQNSQEKQLYGSFFYNQVTGRQLATYFKMGLKYMILLGVLRCVLSFELR